MEPNLQAPTSQFISKGDRELPADSSRDGRVESFLQFSWNTGNEHLVLEQVGIHLNGTFEICRNSITEIKPRMRYLIHFSYNALPEKKEALSERLFT